MSSEVKRYLSGLLQGSVLNEQEAQLCFAALLDDASVPDAQLAAFLTVYRMRPITLDELIGYRSALLQRATRVDFERDDLLDLCGTGGDGKETFNITTLAAIVAAACGQAVVKHGNYSASSACGSSNVLEKLGVKFTADQSVLRRQLELSGITFLHAPLFHPSLKKLAPIRKGLGFRTFINLLGPISNPAAPRYHLCGAADMQIARLYSYFIQREKKDWSIVYSLDGYDEISLTCAFRIISAVDDQLLESQTLSLEGVKATDLQCGNTIEEAAKIFMDILQNKATSAQRNVVAVNAAAALRISKNISWQDALAAAQDALLSGKAAATFKKFVELVNAG